MFKPFFQNFDSLSPWIIQNPETLVVTGFFRVYPKNVNQKCRSPVDHEREKVKKIGLRE